MVTPSLQQNNKRGFTLIEMLVVIAIFLIFTTILLADYKKFGEREEFVNFVYDMSLNLRQVQSSGIAVKETNIATNKFNIGYGVHFSPYADNRTYTTFVDGEDPAAGATNKYYDISSSSYSGTSYDGEIEVEETPDSKEYYIGKVCVLYQSVRTCVQDTDTSPGSVDIVFTRPNPDAYITINGEPAVNDGDPSTPDLGYDSAEIYLTSERNPAAIIERIITMDKTGQISISS